MIQNSYKQTDNLNWIQDKNKPRIVCTKLITWLNRQCIISEQKTPQIHTTNIKTRKRKPKGTTRIQYGEVSARRESFKLPDLKKKRKPHQSVIANQIKVHL